MSVSDRLQALGLELPPPPKPAGVYKPALIIEPYCFVSGHGPLRSDGSLIVGRVGDTITQQQGYDAARQTGLAILSTLKAHLGDLGRIQRVVKLFGMVLCTPDFDQQPAVINGCSELLSEVFGSDLGVGTRSAVGMSALPGGIAVEIEGVFQIA